MIPSSHRRILRFLLAILSSLQNHVCTSKFRFQTQQTPGSTLRCGAKVAAGTFAGGKLLGKIAVGEVSNLVFAGDVLVMLQEKEVTAAKLAVRGPPLPGMFEAVS